MESDAILKQFNKEVAALEAQLDEGKLENGTKKIDVLRDRTNIDTAIKATQNSEDIEYLVRAVEHQNVLTAKYPTLAFQMEKMPKVFWPIMLALALGVWLIAGIPKDKVITLLANTGLHVDPIDVQWTVIIAIAILIFSATVAHRKYIEDHFPDNE